MNTKLFLCLAFFVGINGDQLYGCPVIKTRADWGARNATSTNSTPSFLTYAIIHHGTGPRCFTEDTCKSKVQAYQNYHMDTKGWSDIAYNFIVGEDGNIYEGRGWNVQGDHAGYAINKDSIGICVIGDFSGSVPNTKALDAIVDLLLCAQLYLKLSFFYTLCGHRDVMVGRTCPGQSFYDKIKTWDHYNMSSRC